MNVIVWVSLVALVAGVVTLLHFHWSERRILKGDLADMDARRLAVVLYGEYLAGRVHPLALQAAHRLAPGGFDALNQFILLDVAAGRYREALEWRARWGVELQDREPLHQIIRLNEGEALACLGRHEESLERTAFVAADVYVSAGQAAHRAWVLAELGRTELARRELSASPGGDALSGDYQAEWSFSWFVVEFVDRRWELAARRLNEAEAVAVRETTRRNLDFLRGRLAFAQGDFAGAVSHFARGGVRGYRSQGGASLLEWGDALRQLGRSGEAAAAWSRCIAEDPQSPAAVIARGRLESDGTVSGLRG